MAIGTPLIGLIFDFVMLILLIATITYAARLSLYLKRFRDNRNILDKMIDKLNQNVSDAEHVIQKLNNSTKDMSRDLQKNLDQAASISDELSLMTEAGDNLATRLEKLAERSGAGHRVHLEEDIGRFDAVTKPSAQSNTRSKTAAQANKSRKSVELSEAQAHKQAESFLDKVFAIRDPDAERGINPLDEVDALDSEDDFHSEAERDLMKALQGKKD